jgi:hypothetical protein
MAVRGRTRNGFGANVAAGARPVVDEELLAETIGQCRLASWREIPRFFPPLSSLA